jgi:trehalose-6-phosphate synthase
MSQADRSARMKHMRRNVRKENVFWWVDSFLKAGAKLALARCGDRKNGGAPPHFKRKRVT